MLRLFFAQAVDAHTLLQYAAGRTWGMEALPVLERASGGKPFCPHHPEQQCNLSHSGPHALCALSNR